MERTLEERLKELILDRYGSMVEFSRATGIPNPTLASIMARGVHNAGVSNIIKICHALGIGIDDLAMNKLVPATKDVNVFKETELNRFFKYFKMMLETNKRITIDGYPITREDKDFLVDSFGFALGIVKKRCEGNESSGHNEASFDI